MRYRVITILLVVVAFLLGSAAAAAARTRTFHDAHGDVQVNGSGGIQTGIDIYRERVHHSAHRVVITIHFANLTRQNYRNYFDIAFNVSSRNRGPEFYFDKTGRHRSLYQTGSWSAGTWTRVPCRGLTLQARPARDSLRVAVPRSCLDTPRRVGVSVFIGDSRPGGSIATDYAPRRHSFTPRVRTH